MKHLLLASIEGAYYIVDAKQRLVYTVNQSAYAEIANYIALNEADRGTITLSEAARTIIGASV